MDLGVPLAPLASTPLRATIIASWASSLTVASALSRNQQILALPKAALQSAHGLFFRRRER